jgi:hypothetical protein
MIFLEEIMIILEEERSLDELKELLQTLRLDENLVELSDENSYFLYRVADTVFDWLLKKYRYKIMRVILDRHDVEVANGYDPRQYYPDDESRKADPPF